MGLILKPKPVPKPQVRTRYLFLMPDLGTKAKYAEWDELCVIARYWWRSKVNMTK